MMLYFRKLGGPDRLQVGRAMWIPSALVDGDYVFMVPHYHRHVFDERDYVEVREPSERERQMLHTSHTGGYGLIEVENPFPRPTLN